jgi:L-lactate utilization protein LutC
VSTLETGDRGAYLARLRQRQALGTPENLAHPLPDPIDGVPFAVSDRLDPADLVGSFVRNATAAKVVVHDLDVATVEDPAVADVLASLVERHRVQRIVTSNEPEAQAVAALLAPFGITSSPVGKDASADADLGVTSAIAALATTGTLVQHSGLAGGRTASLLPPVHLCVLPASRIVASTAEVLRGFGSVRLPSNIALITGPSRSGDIEQIIALGVHGPLVVEVLLLRGA